jgi:hypothetical protein
MLHEDLIEVMPAVEEANSISEELDKKVKFEIMLISADMKEKIDKGEVSRGELLWLTEREMETKRRKPNMRHLDKNWQL